ncbi:2-hydroxyhepta-2,4-diene-1,7-dioate isomerase, partial [Streptomyces sp. NPDC041003]
MNRVLRIGRTSWRINQSSDGRNPSAGPGHAHGPTTHDHGRMPMKLLRVGPVGSERPALLDQDGTLRDL